MGGANTASAEDPPLDGAQLYTTKVCLSCHGPDARTPIMPIYPKIAGQNAGYLFNQLRDIKSGARNNGQSVVMMGIMAGVNEDEMRAIADWLATQ
jgi:cytochrome c